MRRGVIAAVAVAALLAVTAAGVAAPAKNGGTTTVEGGNLHLEIGGGISPTALPKHDLAPLTIYGGGTLTTTDGSHPPALKTAVLDADGDIVIDVEGLATCRFGQLRAVDPRRAESICGKALVGRGSATVEVAFPEQTPFRSTGKLLLFNGGERGGAVRFFAYAYVSIPAPTAVVATARVTRIDKGPYGLHPVIDIPLIAGGAGSVVKASIRMGRTYDYEGDRHSVFSGRCSDGRIQARGIFTYRDGTSLAGGTVDTCTATG